MKYFLKLNASSTPLMKCSLPFIHCHSLGWGGGSHSYQTFPSRRVSSFLKSVGLSHLLVGEMDSSSDDVLAVRVQALLHRQTEAVVAYHRNDPIVSLPVRNFKALLSDILRSVAVDWRVELMSAHQRVSETNTFLKKTA